MPKNALARLSCDKTKQGKRKCLRVFVRGLFMDIAKRIVTVRNTMSRRAFAAMLGIKESTLRNYECGSSLPNSDILKNLCEKQSISPEWLLLGTGPMYRGERAECLRNNHLSDASNKANVFYVENKQMKTRDCADCKQMQEKLERVEAEKDRLSKDMIALHKDYLDFLKSTMTKG